MRFVIITLLPVLLLSGCEQPLVTDQQSSEKLNKFMEVVIDGDGKFPEFLVGRWKADKNNWDFVFNPDGSLESAVINSGRARIHPGKTMVIPMKGGDEGVLKPGPWFVGYLKARSELTVEINMEEVYFELGTTLLFGSINDRFVGVVSQDSDQWHVDWTSNLDLAAKAPGEDVIPAKDTEEYKLIFTKVTDSDEDHDH